RARQLLEHEDVREEVRAGAAVLLRNADAEEPELGEPREQLTGKAVRTVPVGRVRGDLGVRELARQRLDLALVGRELEVHARSLTRPFRVEAQMAGELAPVPEVDRVVEPAGRAAVRVVLAIDRLDDLERRARLPEEELVAGARAAELPAVGL